MPLNGPCRKIEGWKSEVMWRYPIAALMMAPRCKEYQIRPDRLLADAPEPCLPPEVVSTISSIVWFV